jgi:hypothetical protein
MNMGEITKSFFKGERHLDRAMFLHGEEGEEWDEGSEPESETELSYFDLAPSDSKRQNGTLSKTIYIDQVMERAHQ